MRDYVFVEYAELECSCCKILSKIPVKCLYCHAEIEFLKNRRIEDPFAYELVAVLRHCGASTHHGHYMAEIKIDDIWWRFDDNRVVFLCVIFFII